MSLANLMVEPNHRAELHSQLMFGDKVTILNDTSGNWQKVCCAFDGYEGWVLKSQLSPVTDEQFIQKPTGIVGFDSNKVVNKGTDFFVFPGTYVYAEDKNISIIASSFKDYPFNNAKQLNILYHFLQTPYMWGGHTSAGIDCSGLVQVFYRFFQINLPHNAAAQMAFGETVDFIQQVVIGDLAFFENNDSEIKHVGIFISPNEIIHAAESNGKVAIDYIDMEGITNKLSGKRTHQLRAIKRLIPLS